MFGIGSAIGKIFGTDKAAKALIDNTSSAIDKLFYTDQEKAEDKANSASEARNMVIKWMAATSGQNLARRILALMISSVWLLQYVAMMSLSVAAVWVEQSEKLTESATVIGEYAKNMNGAMMLILAFYFSAPYMDKIASGVLNKFKGNK